MRFLQKGNVKKTILVISDLHIGAGVVVDKRKNFLESFYYDKELVDFLEYYSTGEYAGRQVELIFNGDIFDLLAVPFVRYFDDEFWSEEASLEKLKLILSAHPEVVQAMISFLSTKNKKIVYILGNHDSELVFKSLRDYFLNLFPEKCRECFEILIEHEEYSPIKGVVLKHGHDFELAFHHYPKEAIVEDNDGRKYFIPPWGSYYITRVLNKFKAERRHVDSVRPVRKFIINGLIYDTLFTIRFMISTLFYLLMVRFIYYVKQTKSLKKIIEHMKKELSLFKDYETLTENFLNGRDDIDVLILGHTHIPIHRSFPDGSVFINAGTWTRMHNLDFEKQSENFLLTYVQIDIKNEETKSKVLSDNKDISLNVWEGEKTLPFSEFQP